MNKYTRGNTPDKEPEPKCHWGWKVLGNAIAMLTLSWLGVTLAERLMG